MDATDLAGLWRAHCGTSPCFGMGGGCPEPLLAAMVRKERKVEEGHIEGTHSV